MTIEKGTYKNLGWPPVIKIGDGPQLLNYVVKIGDYPQFLDAFSYVLVFTFLDQIFNFLFEVFRIAMEKVLFKVKKILQRLAFFTFNQVGFS